MVAVEVPGHPAVAAFGGACATASVCFCVSALNRRRRLAALQSHQVSQSVEQSELWTPRDVAAWLCSTGLPAREAALFEDNRVCGVALQHVDMDALEEMGLTLVGDRLKVIAAIEALRAPGGARRQPSPPRTRAIVLDPKPSPAASPQRVNPTAALQRGGAAAVRFGGAEPAEGSAQQEKLAEQLTMRVQAATELLCAPGLRKLEPEQRKHKLASVAQLVEKVIEAGESLPASLSEGLLPHIKNVQDMLELHSQLLDEEIRVAEVQKRQHELAGGAAGGGERASGRMGELRRLQVSIEQQLKSGDMSGFNVLGQKLCEHMEELESMSEAEIAVLQEIMMMLRADGDSLKQQAQERGARAAQEEDGAGRRLRDIVDMLEQKGIERLPFQQQADIMQLGFDVLESLTDEDRVRHRQLVLRVSQALLHQKDALKEELARQSAGRPSSPTGSSPQRSAARPPLSPRSQSPRGSAASPQRELRIARRPRSEGSADSTREAATSPLSSGAIASQAKALMDVVGVLQSTGFDELPQSTKLNLLLQGYQFLEKLPAGFQQTHPTEVGALLQVLQEKQDVIVDAAGSGEAEEDGEGENEDGEGENEDGDAEGRCLTEADLLPKVLQRLRSEDFVETTSKFELDNITWVMQAVGTQPQYSELLSAVHGEMESVLEQVSSIPPSRGMPFGSLSCQQVSDGHFELQVTKTPGEPEKSHVIARSSEPVPSTPDSKQAVLVVVESVQSGTERMEVLRLAEVLRKYHGYDCTLLSGESATKENVVKAVRAAAERVEGGGRVLLCYKSNVEMEHTALAFQGDETASLGHLVKLLPFGSVALLDLHDDFVLATAGLDGEMKTLRMSVAPTAALAVETECSWLLDGFFIPVVCQLLSDKDEAPPTYDELFREMQITMTGRGPQYPQRTVCDSADTFSAVPI
eukprot:TRINITY_DN1873_c0_g1_i1.p1 TRINITY_DN1873_c0_g1~~TRINITY_DN1873_c0_g1_i1.p1  ORF type:complete len:923 (+),score=295.79 TRINITY_DN1873_c0_g1_i1:72-2840(+)